MAIEYRRYRMAPAMASVLGQLGESATGLELSERLKTLVERAHPRPGLDGLNHVLAPYGWLLSRAAASNGIPLTDAGWMKPAVVKEFAPVLPTMDGWLAKVGRESDAYPVALFRERLQSLRLLRKFKSSLRLTQAGKAALEAPTDLWSLLAEQLVPDDPPFDTALAVVLLLHAATTDGEIDRHEVARVVTELGWGHADGPITEREIYPVWNSTWVLYGNVGRLARSGSSDRTPSPAAVALIRDALLTEVRG